MACPPDPFSSVPSPLTSRLMREGSPRPQAHPERSSCAAVASRWTWPPEAEGHHRSEGTQPACAPRARLARGRPGNVIPASQVVTDVSTATRLNEADQGLPAKPHVSPRWSLLACPHARSRVTRGHRSIVSLLLNLYHLLNQKQNLIGIKFENFGLLALSNISF